MNKIDLTPLMSDAVPAVPITIGFTGTQHGMSTSQSDQVKQIIDQIFDHLSLPIQNGIHGCCIGADEQFHEIMWKHFGIPSILCPSNIEDKTAEITGGVLYRLEPEDPLKRNRTIVNASDVLIAAPKENHEVVRSGTWSTIRYARKRLTKVIEIVER